MSVQRNQYIIMGCKYNYKEFNEKYDDYEKYVDPYWDSPFDEKIVKHNELSMIYDGTNGEYVYIGRIIKKTRDDDIIEYFCFEDCNIWEEDRESTNAIIKTEFSKLPDKPIEIYLVTHYR